MKRSMWAYSAMLSLVGAGMAQAGSLTYHAINSDADSDISTSNTYTAAVNYGGNDVAINGVTFANGYGDGVATSLTAGGATYSLANGTLSTASFIFYTSPIADGQDIKTLLSNYIYNSGDSVQPATVTLNDLTAGQNYDFRVYIRPIGVNWNRPVTFDFTGDGTTTTLSGYWDNSLGLVGYNEDVPSTVGFANGDQAYYINYNFTYDGVSTPGFSSTSSFGGQGLIMYGISNQLVVPEPASLGLLAGAGLLLARRRR